MFMQDDKQGVHFLEKIVNQVLGEIWVAMEDVFPILALEVVCVVAKEEVGLDVVGAQRVPTVVLDSWLDHQFFVFVGKRVEKQIGQFFHQYVLVVSKYAPFVFRGQEQFCCRVRS